MNWLDLIVISLSYVCIAFNIYRQVQVNNLLGQLLDQQPKQYNDFSHLCYWQYQFNNIISATIFLAWIKVRWILFFFYQLSRNLFVIVECRFLNMSVSTKQ